MMEHGKLFEAIRDIGAFEDVQVVAYNYGTPDIEVTIPSKCKFFALIVMIFCDTYDDFWLL